MSVKLFSVTVQKLTHESPEIRLRTLDQIEAKVMRALAHNEEIEFSPGELFKQLIRWFGFQPIQSAEKVIVLLMRLVRSPYGPTAIEQLGLRRFIKELGRVKDRLKGERLEVTLVEQLLQELQNQKQEIDICDMIEKLSINDDYFSSSSCGSIIRNKVSAKSASSFSKICEKYTDKDYELSWSQPSIADYNAMKLLANALDNPSTTGHELETVLQHLQITMPDYPAEYMLQAPFIILKILELYERHENVSCSLENIISICIVFLGLLKKRLHMRSQCITYMPKPNQTSAMQPKVQLSFEKTIHILMEMCLDHFEREIYEIYNETDQVLVLFSKCLELCEMQKLSISKLVTQKLIKICEKLNNFSDDENFVLHRIQFLLLACLLQQITEINYISKRDIGFEMQYIQNALVFDYAMSVCYPKRYEALKEFCIDQSDDLKVKCELLAKYESEIKIAVALINAQHEFTPIDILAKCNNMKFALETFESLKLIEICYNAIKACLPYYQENSDLRTQATNVLHTLIALPDENNVALVINKLAMAVKKNFACLMTGENYCTGVCNTKLLSQQIIGVPLATDLLFKLIQRGSASENIQIMKNCEEIFTLLLKSQHLIGNNWPKLLDLIKPVMALLQCIDSSILNVALINLHNPDDGNVPFLDMIKGNIRYLFHRDKEIRNEALTRIIYTLSIVRNAENYLPNIMEISDLIPNDVCILKVSREISRFFASNEAFNDLSTLQNLLELLQSPDIEPSIRLSSLLQINVMCNNWKMSMAMCTWSAYFIPLNALENSLHKESYTNYIESAKPAIGILQKLLLCDAEFREELAATENIYLLLLRALFLFTTDLQAQQDAAMCLFLLTFSTFIVATDKIVEVPKIMSNFVLPLRCCYIQSEYKEECISEFNSIFKTVAQGKFYLRQFVAACGCDGGLLHINKKWLLETQMQYSYGTNLKLTQNDLRFVQATNPLMNLQRIFRSISNATEHNAFINAVMYLKKQLILCNLTTDVIELPQEFSATLLQLINRYTLVSPGGKMDFLLFENIVELSILCMRLNLPNIIEGTFKMLQDDFQHAFIHLLRNIELPLGLYRKICQALLYILRFDAIESSTETSILYSNLFELFSELINQLFAKRDLQRVRCLLGLLNVLSTKILHMSDGQLMAYCKRLLKLSVELKASTQTGAQWHRDCLQIVCSLSAQMSRPKESYHLRQTSIKYLSGMCGHSDHEVRALSWCCLANVARYDNPQRLMTELSFLPGGFLACCLSTLMDTKEIVLVRQLAGRLYAEMLSMKCSNFNETSLLLEQHIFFRTFHESLSCCVVSSTLPNLDDSGDIATCEIISCFCNICIELLNMDSDFIMELCEKPFMCRLYELLKLNYGDDGSTGSNITYLSMCSDICHLYALCSERNFPFLQRTLCRDQIWLRKFCKLFGEPFASDEDLQNVLQLLLAICKDTQSYECVCENVIKRPQVIVNILLEALKIPNLDTSLQHDSLTLLSFLLIKSQLDEDRKADINFIDVLQKPIQEPEPATSNEQRQQGRKQESRKESTTTETIAKINKRATLCISTAAQDYPVASSTKTNKRATICSTSVVNNPDASIMRPSAELIFLKLRRLFLHVYPSKCCKFDSPPSSTKIKICETISILLKVSKSAQTMACNLGLLESIIEIFKNFREEYKIPCATFVRRYGESKKSAVISNFQLLINMMLNWFASTTAVLTQELHSIEITKLLQQIWPWLSLSNDLKLLVLQFCQILSEHSHIVCIQFSTHSSSSAESILQLVLKLITIETQRIKAASTEDFPCITIGLRIVSNCCACPEGRNVLIKARVLDIIDSIYPFNAKATKLKAQIVHSWLQFWEVFSRYDEGAQAHYLTAVCYIISNSKKYSATRLLLLKILRNMSFLKSNCNVLLNSKEFLCVVSDVVASSVEGKVEGASASCTYEEEFVVCVAIWKLISNGVKYVALIRGTKLNKKFKILHELLTSLHNEDQQQFKTLPYGEDLLNTLGIILTILNS